MTRLNEAIARAAREIRANMGHHTKTECPDCAWPGETTRQSIAGALEGDVIAAGILADYQKTYKAEILHTWQYYVDVRAGRPPEETLALNREVEQALIQICLGRKLPENAFHQQVQGAAKGFWKLHVRDSLIVVYYRAKPDRITLVRTGSPNEVLGDPPPTKTPEDGQN